MDTTIYIITKRPGDSVKLYLGYRTDSRYYTVECQVSETSLAKSPTRVPVRGGQVLGWYKRSVCTPTLFRQIELTFSSRQRGLRDNGRSSNGRLVTISINIIIDDRIRVKNIKYFPKVLTEVEDNRMD